MDFHKLVQLRRSYRKFTGEPVDAAQLKLILEAGLMSPAGKRKNPWRFIVIEDRETLKALSTAKAQGALPIAGAAAAIAVTANPADSDTWIEDLSISAIIMQLQAQELGLGSVWIQMRLRDDENGQPASRNCARILGLPEDTETLCVLALGHPDEERKPYDLEKLSWEKVSGLNLKS